MSNGEDSVLSNGPLMIDVGGKEVTHRVAKAECTVTMIRGVFGSTSIFFRSCEMYWSRDLELGR